jgi:hypothetical protein
MMKRGQDSAFSPVPKHCLLRLYVWREPEQLSDGDPDQRVRDAAGKALNGLTASPRRVLSWRRSARRRANPLTNPKKGPKSRVAEKPVT